MKRNLPVILSFLISLLCAGCTSGPGYTSISQDEAVQMMKDDNAVILDVRTIDEYNELHIRGAICIPVDTIDESISSFIPDTGQVILVYCRSGNRSRQASEKLAALGYTNVYEFGGINTWKGETE